MANGTLKSFTEVQAFLTNIITQNGNDIDDAPHGAFWNNLTYDQFVNGTVPHVGGSYPILVKGNSKTSNIILALQGQGPFTGNPFPQMPADGPPYFSNEQISELAAWIDAGCPEGSSAVTGTTGNPTSTVSVSFAQDIVPLFREQDIQCMRNMDVLLINYEYMSQPANAKLVYDHLTGDINPRMPYGGPYWSPENIELFKQWMDDGFPK